MTNRIALFLAACVIAGLTVDYVYFNQDGTLFMARKTVELIEWLAFWR